MLLNTNTNHKSPERGYIKRFGEMPGIKQDALVIELDRVCPESGDGTWNQQKISLLEQKETIDVPLLQRISAELKIPMEVIQNFDEEQEVNVIANIFGGKGVGCQRNENPVFHPNDQLIKLREEKIEFYERMLKAKEEMMVTLKGLIESK